MSSRLLAALACALALPTAARADDTRPPRIAEVKASSRGGKVTVEARITDETGVLSATCHHRSGAGRTEGAPMVKDEFSDIFRASFAGGPESEYWIEATDLLGNGPATYGSASKAVAVGGAATEEPPKTVASAPPVKKKAAPPAPPRQAAATQKPAAPVQVARSAPPQVDHRKPVQPPEGKDLSLEMKIHSDTPVTVAVLQARPHGSSQPFTNVPLKGDGDSYEGQIPASLAHGSVEYFIVARNEAGDVTHHGDGDTRTPFVIAFKAAAAPSGPVAAAPARASSPSLPAFTITHLPPVRVAPGRPIPVRAQVVPNGDGEPAATVAVLWRGADARDQMTEMGPDETGGWGGYKVQLPPQEEGAVFFQIVACDARAARCGVDTGSKRRWHATTIAKNPGTPAPMALDAVSSKAPPSLPE